MTDVKIYIAEPEAVDGIPVSVDNIVTDIDPLFSQQESHRPEPTGHKIYIAGPMTGIKYFNFPAFDEAAEFLRFRGWEVLSPADHDRASGFDPVEMNLTGHENPHDYDLDLNLMMWWDIQAIMDSRAVYMLKNWERSTGARAEHALALWAGKEIYYEETLL